MVGRPEISLNASEAFCVDVDFDSNALALIAWQLHEGAYQLSGGFDASFDSLDNLHTVFEGSKNSRHKLRL